MDAMLLYSETPNVHTHTVKVAVCDVDGAGVEALRLTLRQRLGALEPLRYRLVDIPGRIHHPMWLENGAVDADAHLFRTAVAAPGGRRELDEVVGRIASTPLDRARPLWEVHCVEGVAGGRVALVLKLHHALADGVASANLLSRLMDAAHTDAVPDGTDRCGAPGAAELLATAARDHLRLFAELPEVIGAAVAGVRRVRRRARQRDDPPGIARPLQAPATFLNHVLSPARAFASTALSLPDVKATGRKLGLTVNDLVMATTAGALRTLLLRHDGRADEPLVGSVIASTDRSADRILGNQLSGMPVSLPVHLADPAERIRLTAAATAIAKEDHELLGPDLFGRLVDYLPPPAAPPAFAWIARRQSRNRLFNLPISNVPGPRDRGFIAGYPVAELYSVGPLPPGCGVNITVWSYVDQLTISVITDDVTVEDPHEITDALADAYDEITLLADAAGRD
jgi:diacylglycerol O-acyltransferase / wax synthase